jgi:hypothetical protein
MCPDFSVEILVGGLAIAFAMTLGVIALLIVEYRLNLCIDCLEDNIDKEKLFAALQESYEEGRERVPICSLSERFKVPEFMVRECVKELVKEERCFYNPGTQIVIILGFRVKEN